MGGAKCGTGFGTKQWINLEPCGLICGMMTWLLLIFGIIYGMYCHMSTMLTDPGSVPRESIPLADDEAEQNFKAFCKRCAAFKPIRAHHCSICGRCIVKMDHHCPWVNNCVGIGNQKLFLLFLLSVNLVCIYALFLVIGKFLYCSSSNTNSLDILKEKNVDAAVIDANVMIVFLLVESVLFGLFTLCMMGDQTSVLATNQTQIDKLKGIRNEGVEGFNEVFGCDDDIKFKYEWLLPTRIQYPDTQIKERVLGYRLVSAEEAKMIEMNKKRRQGELVDASESSPARDSQASSENKTDSRRRGSRSTQGIPA
eukprot:GSChrysophyteH1.ASY1.ANO1.1303.1 assembled CDS